MPDLFLSPPVRMHGGLICITFCMSVCHLTKIQARQKVTRPKIIALPVDRLEINDGKVFCFKGHEEPWELAGGLTSTSSCIFN